MRPFVLAATLAIGSTAAAQQKPVTPDSAARVLPAVERQQLDSQLASLRAAGNAGLPTADRFSLGDHSVPAGTTMDGPIAVARGNLEVFGTLNGDAIVIDGNVRVHRGARIAGDAIAVGG